MFDDAVKSLLTAMEALAEEGYRGAPLNAYGCIVKAQEALGTAFKLSKTERKKALLQAAGWTMLSYIRDA